MLLSSISEFHLLAVLAQEMNMRKASERLFVSQPALSQRLQTIEKEWGTKLFIRSQKGLSLTPAGEHVIQFVNEVLVKEEKVRETIHSLQSGVSGTLKMAVASIVGQNWLPPVLKKYSDTYPQAKISLITGWSSEILKSLYDDQVHIGIIRGTPDWKGVKIKLFSDPLSIWWIETLPNLNSYWKRTDLLSNLKAIQIITKKSRIGGCVNLKPHQKEQLLLTKLRHVSN